MRTLLLALGMACLGASGAVAQIIPWPPPNPDCSDRPDRCKKKGVDNSIDMMTSAVVLTAGIAAPSSALGMGGFTIPPRPCPYLNPLLCGRIGKEVPELGSTLRLNPHTSTNKKDMNMFLSFLPWPPPPNPACPNYWPTCKKKVSPDIGNQG